MLTPKPHNGPLGVSWLLFNPVGRVSREPYWLGFALIWTLMGIPFNTWLQSIDLSGGLTEVTIVDFVNSNPLIPFLLFAIQWVELALVIKRLQDRGLTGFLAIFIFLPLINIFFIVALGFIPGETGPNRYGPAPNSRWKRPEKT